MALEVSRPEYYFRRDPPESHLDQVTKPISEKAAKSPILPMSNSTAEESGLSAVKTTPTPKNAESMGTRNNSTPAQASSGLMENDPVVSEIFSVPSDNVPIPDRNSSMTTESSSGLVGNSIPPVSKWTPTFWANYVHDLESIWWILIWTLLTYEKVGDGNNTPDSNLEIQRRSLAANKIFHLNQCHIERWCHFQNIAAFNGLAVIIPDFFKRLVEVAAIFREKLILTYIKEEGKLVFPIKLMDDGLLHRDILEAFRTSPIENFDVVHIYTKNKSATKSTTDSDETSESSKRAACEDSDEEKPRKRARY